MHIRTRPEITAVDEDEPISLSTGADSSLTVHEASMNGPKRNIPVLASISKPIGPTRRKLLVHERKAKFTPTPAPKPDIEFTAEDVKLLKGEYDSLLNLDEDRLPQAWAAWAEEVGRQRHHLYLS